MMIVRLIGALMMAASTVDATVTVHEALATMKSPAAMVAAARTMPLDAENDLRAAAAAEPSAAERSLRAAVTKNPWDTHSWIELSVHAETRGDQAGAEQALRQAAAHDIGREPRWALANYYFRQGDQTRFVDWVNSYRSVTHDREESLFRMVSEIAPDAQSWTQQMPNLRCDELKTAVDVLKTEGRSADTLVDRMSATCRDTGSTEALSKLVSDLLMKDQAARAGEIWQGMGGHAGLANGDFAQAVTGEGFDWRINKTPEVEERADGGKGLEFALGDDVSDGTVLMFQPVLLDGGRRYRVTMEAKADGSNLEPFRWELVELSTGRHLTTELDGENLSGQPTWEFRVPATNRTLALALYYKRPEGETGFRGNLQVHGVQLTRELTPDAAAPARRS